MIVGNKKSVEPSPEKSVSPVSVPDVKKHHEPDLQNTKPDKKPSIIAKVRQARLTSMEKYLHLEEGLNMKRF